MADVITLDLLKRVSRELRENSVTPTDGIYVLMPHPDLLRDLFWKPPARRSASARKRKAGRYWRKSGIWRK